MGFDVGSMLVRGWLNDGARLVAPFSCDVAIAPLMVRPSIASDSEFACCQFARSWLVRAWLKASSGSVRCWFVAGSSVVHGWFNAGSLLVESWFVVGSILVHGWLAAKYSANLLLVRSWCVAGFGLVQD